MTDATTVKPLLTDRCSDCHIPFADCVHRDARINVIAKWEATPKAEHKAALEAKPRAKAISDEEPGINCSTIPNYKPCPDHGYDHRPSCGGCSWNMQLVKQWQREQEKMVQKAGEPAPQDQKPEPPPVPLPGAEQLPLELRTKPNWVCWNYGWEERTEIWRKLPYSPRAGASKWQDNLVSFDEAYAMALRDKHGIGYKPKLEDGLVFLDFDDCLRGNDLDPAVANWLSGFPEAYCEITPSRTGLRVVVKGKTREISKSQHVPSSSRESTVEIYTQKNYVTVTGIPWGIPRLAIGDGQRGLDLLIAKLNIGTAADGKPAERARTLDDMRSMYGAMLKTFRGMVREEDSQNDQLNICAWFAARAFKAGALKQTEKQLKDELRQIANSTRYCPGIEDSLSSGWGSGIAAGPFQVLDPEQEHNNALDRITALLADKTLAVDLEDAERDAALLTTAEYDQCRKQLAKRLGFSRIPVFDQEVAKRRRPATQDSSAAFDAATATLDDVRVFIEGLLDDEPNEADRKLVETTIWNYIRAHAQVFCCGGVGYLLLRSGDGVPIAVTKDGQDFNQLLIRFGVHPGSPTRNRIGQFIGTKCYHEGIKAETQLSFSFVPRTFTAYVARDRGRLIRVTRKGFEDVPNGTDGQLFIFPANWQPLLSVPIPVPNPIRVGGDLKPTAIFKRALFPDGNLVRHFFSGTTFEIRSMSEQQVRILILAYVFFLIMPGVVSERAMLQALGPSGSGKTFLLEYIGRLLLGDKFKAQPLPEDLKEFENQIINQYFIVYDNVSRVPGSVKDRFCQAVTGVDVVRRELFTTAQEARYPSKATIALSAIEPPLQELEHQNRTISINFQERTEGSFIAKEELFKQLDYFRNDIILNLLWRMRLVLEALEAQRHYVPRTNMRLASVATFILRIARHEGWEERANQLLDAWAGEQTDYSMTEDDVSIAFTRWIGGLDWKPNVELTSSMLNDHLCQVMGVTERGKDKLNWRGNHLVLAKMLIRNGKVYASRFGMKQQQSTLRTSRGTNTYRFNPTPEQLAGLQEAARYERENAPRTLDFGPQNEETPY